MQKSLIIFGIIILVVDLLYPYLKKIGLSQLPDNIIYKSTTQFFSFQ